MPMFTVPMLLLRRPLTGRNAEYTQCQREPAR